MCIYNRTEETAPKMPQNFVYSKPKELWETSRWQLRQWLRKTEGDARA